MSHRDRRSPRAELACAAARDLLPGTDATAGAYRDGRARDLPASVPKHPAKGFVFLTLEDETGLVNVTVVTPQRFERQALLISRTPLLLVRGVLPEWSGGH
jgi:hypothetical protein